MKKTLLQVLREDGGYVSGQQFCDRLGVSRTAVWKHINALKADGYEIEAAPNRGYRLMHSPDVLTEAEMASRRTDLWKDAPTVVFPETDSTNIQADRMAESGAPEGTLLAADVQNGGRGRRGRGWVMPKGTGLAMSFILRPSFAPDIASMLTLLAAMSARRAVEDLTGIRAMIKWPNDIVLNRKKVCGILTEMKLEEAEIRHIVVGLGFNTGQESFPEELADKATSLYLETGEHISRAELGCRVIRYFAEYYQQFCEEKDLSFMKEEYESCLINLGQEIRVITPSGEWIGIARGIDESGELLAEDREGHLQRIASGEVSVRGLYSYV